MPMPDHETPGPRQTWVADPRGLSLVPPAAGLLGVWFPGGGRSNIAYVARGAIGEESMSASPISPTAGAPFQYSYESKVWQMDFANWLAAGEVIQSATVIVTAPGASAPDVTTTVVPGASASPAAAGVSGSIVYTRLHNLTPQQSYTITFIATTSVGDIDAEHIGAIWCPA